MGSDYWTSKKAGTGHSSTITLTSATTIPASTSLVVTLFEDVGQDGGANTDAIGNGYDNSTSVTLSGGSGEANDLTGFDGGGSTNDYWMHVELDGDGSDPTLDSPTVDSLSIGTGDAPTGGGRGPFDTGVGIDLPLRPLNLSSMETGIAIFLSAVLALLLGAAAVLRNYVAGVFWAFAVFALLASGLFNIGLELFWAIVIAIAFILAAGMVARWSAA